jgi:hypothetical protein
MESFNGNEEFGASMKDPVVLLLARVNKKLTQSPPRAFLTNKKNGERYLLFVLFFRDANPNSASIMTSRRARGYRTTLVLCRGTVGFAQFLKAPSEAI